MHITSLAYFPVLVKVLHNELPWKCPKLDGLSTLFCIIVENMTLYHTINTLCISTDYLVTRWQRLLVHNSGYFHKPHLFKVTNDPPVLLLHSRKRYLRPLESESATRMQIVEVPWTWHEINQAFAVHMAIRANIYQHFGHWYIFIHIETYLYKGWSGVTQIVVCPSNEYLWNIHGCMKLIFICLQHVSSILFLIHYHAMQH